MTVPSDDTLTADVLLRAPADLRRAMTARSDRGCRSQRCRGRGSVCTRERPILCGHLARTRVSVSCAVLQSAGPWDQPEFALARGRRHGKGREDLLLPSGGLIDYARSSRRYVPRRASMTPDRRADVRAASSYVGSRFVGEACRSRALRRAEAARHRLQVLATSRQTTPPARTSADPSRGRKASRGSAAATSIRRCCRRLRRFGQPITATSRDRGVDNGGDERRAPCRCRN
jgi:hypothetical protein